MIQEAMDHCEKVEQNIFYISGELYSWEESTKQIADRGKVP